MFHSLCEILCHAVVANTLPLFDSHSGKYKQSKIIIVFEWSDYNWVKLCLMWNINPCLVQGFISNVQSSWDSSCAIAAIRWHTTAADLLGWDSGAWACRVMPLSSTGRSQDSSGGYKCCTIALSRAPLTMPSLPWISCLTVPNLRLPWSPSSPLIRTTSPGFTVTSPVLWVRLWLSLNALRCSVVHPGHRISLQCFRYFAHFLRLTSSIASASSSVNCLGCPNSIALDVRTDIWTSSSTYRKGQLFRVLSTSRITSFSSCYRRFPFPMDLHTLCFMMPVNLSNWPHHHDARLRLNCHAIPCLASRSLSFSSFPIFLHHCCCNESFPIVSKDLPRTSLPGNQLLDTVDELFHAKVR